ncbi:hypothetical protein ACN6MT_27610 [Neobacillus niacini]|uniref:hypothetical protein n=1 Tax=Neobacillus niacini TaxID=86668 RepID=UPI003B022F03
MGFVIIFLLMYFIVRVIGIYKKEIILFFRKFSNGILTLNLSMDRKSFLTNLEALGFYKHTDTKLVEELKKLIAKAEKPVEPVEGPLPQPL